ncbi:MAG: mercuric reductase [Methylomonas sp.]|jgi:copper chaperone CopZ|nr:MAG: mercuric reductase [Methylomonas sp.]
MSESVSISVTGMKCGGCENTVTTALMASAGVLSVKASHKDKQVNVEFDPSQTDLESIEDIITDAGFSVE